MRIQPETTRPSNALVITGHFRDGSGYAVFRPAGTDDFLLMLTLSGRGRIGLG